MLTLLLILPLSPIARDSAPVVEHNTCLDESGAVYLEQLVWWSPDAVVDWRLTSRTGIPEYDHERRVWRSVWLDGEVIRVIEAKSCKRSFTFGDPELADRERLPKDERRGLR